MNRPGYSLTGMDIIIGNIKSETTKMKMKALGGMIEGAVGIRRDMDHKTPKIPVDLGNLRASWFITTTLGAKQEEGEGTFTEVDKEGKRVRPAGFAAKMATDHSSVLSQAQAEVNTASKMTLIMGFSANYAIWVHEMLGDVNWNRPGSGAWFFRQAINTNRELVLQKIAKAMKIR
jgi:hypothetical protein